MPQQQIIPTWLAWNNCNFTSQSGLTDVRTGQPFNAGGLNAGDYFDATNDEAGTSSYTTNGILYEGRYRLVLVDSGATAANVKTGTVGYLRNGSTVKSAVTLTAGSGQTAGTYQIAATAGSGGGSGAIIQVVVTAAGTVTASPVVINPGFNYSSVPTFTMPASAGGTGATFAAQLNTTPNVVTSADQVAASIAVGIRPVVFLNSITPGNYGFVQELGTATVLGKAGVNGAAGDYVNAVTTDNGVVTTTAASGSPIGTTLGRAVDTPQASNLFKAYLGYAALTVQD